MIHAHDFKRQVAAGDYHILNPYDGITNHQFPCARCGRQMPDDHYSILMNAQRIRGILEKTTRSGLIVLKGRCRTCRKQERGKWAKHPLYTAAMDRHFSKYTAHVRGQAIGRGIFFGLQKDDVLGLYIKQEGLCALTGIPMRWGTKGERLRGTRSLNGPSLDRIDSAKDYTIGNVQFVLNIVNIMKTDLPQEQFIALCRAISSHTLTM